MGNWNKFTLLMWKNFLLQWRHPRQTIVEIMAPVFFCCLLVFIRSLVEPNSHPARFYTPFKNTVPVKRIASLMKIAWSPKNPNLDKIMDETVKAISQDEHLAIKSMPFENSTTLNIYLQKDRNAMVTFAGIEFDDSLTGNVPLKNITHVTIRFPGELRAGVALGAKGLGQYTWKTNALFPFYQIAGPRGWDMNRGAEPSYHYEGFLKLQQELSYSIISHLKQTSKSAIFRRSSIPLVMQRFPYPKWMEDVLLTALEAVVGLVIMLSFVYTCISTVKVITTEKELQLKEAMEIMGLPNWLHWTAWFIKSFFLMLVTITLIVILLKAKWYKEKNCTIFSESNPFVILVFLVFFVCATITFCFAVSVFFSKANTAATVAGMIWFVSYFPYSFVLDKYHRLSLSQKLFTCLCSNSAMAYGFQLILVFEGNGEGVQWRNVWKTTSPDDTLKLGHIMIMLTIDTVFYWMIAMYVEAVFPGDYGVPKIWYFPFTRSYWFGHSRCVDIEGFQNSPIENEYLEKEPTNLQVGLKIQHLRKVYGNNRIAVRDLTLNMYKDQITVLLGHNGAGKTTTLSILTGMIPPTSGTAIIDGYDITTSMQDIRDSFGLCPQRNILFDELTVKEHLLFYSQLKGLSKDKINDEIKKYVELLELEPKINSASGKLSGGMKRKLSVGIAMCGNSAVVMLDEPTAGVDPSARRALWDLLQSQKKGRTILLTTHFMDEADLLGDRIAIMAGGKLQCCGSSFFLKKKYGTGYHLIMDKSINADGSKITSLLQRHIPNIQIESDIGAELSYELNEDKSSVFEKMLRDLERESARLGILSYGISLTTLEEVFMKVGADHGQEEINNEIENSTKKVRTSSIYVNHIKNSILKMVSRHNVNKQDSILDTSKKVLSGYPLRLNQIKAMFMKRGLSILRAWLLFIVQNLIPVLFLILAIVVVRGLKISQDLPKLKIQLDAYEDPVTVLIHNKNNEYAIAFVNYLKSENHDVIDLEDDNMTIHMFDKTINNPSNVRLRYIVGATFKDNAATAWFNNQPYHSPPLSMQLVMNSIIKKEISPYHSIQIYNHPLQFKLNTKLIDVSTGRYMGFQIAFYIGFSMAFVSSFYVMFYVRERVSKSKHLQFVSGVGILEFWGSSFVCDCLTFTFTFLCIILTLIIFQVDGYTKPIEIGRIFMILTLFEFSALPMMYVASFFFDIPSTGYTRMTLFNIFTGVAGFIIVQILTSPKLELEYVADFVHWAFLIIPLYSLSTGIRDMNVVHATHSLCDAMLESCVSTTLPGFPRPTPDQCLKQLCAVQEHCCTMTRNYLDWKSPGIGRNVIYLSCVGVALILILLLIEYKLFEKIRYKLKKILYKPPQFNENENEDEDVRLEKIKVKNLSAAEIKNYNLVMRDITKYFNNFLAVNRLCLSVNKYECFGLLGVNGAGKSTTFKMLTGDFDISSGDAWMAGINLKTDMNKIYRLIGYCPQFDALLDDLTSRETLIIFGLLRGFTTNESKLIAQQLAVEFDFLRHLDKQIRQLSGGNKRKLSTALAMIGNPLVLYLDEPTTGMDPATKRYFWNALCKIRDRGTSIILTSHSMEECEALCTRLTVMVNGTFKCLGSTQHLKSKFSEGYTLIIKVGKTDGFDGDKLNETDIHSIEEFVKKKFKNAIIREKHQGLITFYIADKSLPWSKMFGIMEKGKKSLNIEDYSLGQSSLEQVFLTFTKHQMDELITSY